MAIVVHHLNNSRSQRILWLLEELGAEYDIRSYKRDAETNLAPPELASVHPLGKSPVIEDDGLLIAESGAIVQWLCERHGGENWLPDPQSDNHASYLEWMQFAEGSVIVPIMLRLYTSRLGEAGAPLQDRIDSQLGAHFGYMDDALAQTGHFVGDDWTAADVMLSFPAEIAVMQGMGERFENLSAFVEAVHARPAWKLARERGGPYFGW